MGDIFIECVVKSKTSKQELIKRAAIIGAIVLVYAVLMFLFMSKIFLFIGIILASVCFRLSDPQDAEYEYVYVNGELDFAEIKNKSKRKEILTISMTGVDVMAPKDAEEVKRFLGNPKVKYQKFDFSSRSAKNQDKVYEIVGKNGSQAYHVVFEPNEELLKAMKQAAPRNVFEN